MSEEGGGRRGGKEPMSTGDPRREAVDAEIVEFGPEVLLVFIGHSSDSDLEANGLRDLEGDLQRDLEQMAAVVSGDLAFKSVRCWEWNYDAPPVVGGQERAVSPALRRADIAAFVFKERLGRVTWKELEHTRTDAERSIPVVAFFPARPPAAEELIKPVTARLWSELMDAKERLTADWTEQHSKSLTPTLDYRDLEHLKEIARHRLKAALVHVLRKRRDADQKTAPPGAPVGFLGTLPHLSFDRQPVLAHTTDDLVSELVNRFLQRPLSVDQIEEATGSRDALQLPIAERLQLLGCLSGGRPTLGAFLCFAPMPLLVDKSEACSLQLVAYDQTSRATAAASISKVNGNLIELFDKGMKWLTGGAGLRRQGSPGSESRDELEIPVLVLHEALANSIVHRDYELPGLRDQPTRVEVYPDRVEITSFGNLPTVVPVNALNADDEIILSWRRNPVIARIFQHLSHVELNASGIPRMRSLMTAASLALPKFINDLQGGVFRVVLQRPSRWADEEDSRQLTASLGVERGLHSRSGSVRHVPKVFISSTADLHEHRRAAIDACLRLGMMPILFESLAADARPLLQMIQSSVDSADVFVGIIGRRYGAVPKGQSKSFTHLEYERARERGLPTLAFVMHHDHPLRADVEAGPGGPELETLKAELKGRSNVGYFKSPEDLRAQVLHALSDLSRERGLLEQRQASSRTRLLYDIPPPPAAYVVHPYTLLQTKGLIGRRDELKQLNDWIAHLERPDTTILCVVALGGMGKSALAWHWFTGGMAQETDGLAGRMWWSFYEGTSFDEFIIRTLAYVSRRDFDEIESGPLEMREQALLEILDRQPFLLVFDGFERQLVAYSHVSAAYLGDEDLNEKATDRAPGIAGGGPQDAGREYVGHHSLRRAVDPRMASFLRKLSRVHASRVLMSTRLYPADLQTETGDPWPGCAAITLKGLSEEDALELWRAQGALVSREAMLPLFERFERHPLLIQMLASEVARFREAPGNFDAWRAAHPDFDPFALPLVQARFDVLEASLRGLPPAQARALDVLAVFREPTTFDVLKALLIRTKEKEEDDEVAEQKPFTSLGELDMALGELEDRGLLGWDRHANRYDLHPIVRGVTLSRMGR